MPAHEEAETIHLTADIIAVTHEGPTRRALRHVMRRLDTRRVLLIQRKYEPHAGAWALPGGHADAGEASTDAAIRELLEETGVRLVPTDLKQLGAWDAPDRDLRGRYVTVAYLATVPASTTITAGDDARRAAWWPLNALPKNLAFDHADILRAAAL